MDRRGKERPHTLPQCGFSPHEGQETHSASLEGAQTGSLVSIFPDILAQPLRGPLTCSSPRILK